jgi:hypothetical protein
MMRSRYAEVVRRLLRGRLAAPPSALPSDRRRLVAAVEEALRARARRRAFVRRAGGVSLAVAAALTFFVAARGGWLGRRGGTIAQGRTSPSSALTVLDEAPAAGQLIGPDGAPGPVVRGVVVDAGLRLVAPPSGEVTVGTTDGTLLTLGASGDLAVLEAGRTRRFALRAGVVNVRVVRLVAGERFVIETADAAIEVHGAALKVALVAPDPNCGGGARTRVSVSEGDVRVRAGEQDVALTAGGQWPADCNAAVHAAHAPNRRALPRQRATAASALPVAPASPTAPVSSLGVENDLFAEAVRARKAGELTHAAATFGRLIDEHPRSPLLESAMVQRMRLLATLDRTAGISLAHAYLSRFPAGAARPEAERLTAPSGP